MSRAAPGRSARAATALAHLPEHDPALAALALWCRVVDGDGPSATRGETILIGPEFEALPLREQIGLLGHHILHIALRHSARQAGMAQRQGGLFDPARFNLAADALVNAVIEAGGHAVPRPAVSLQSLAAEVLLVPPEEASVSRWDVERLYVALAGQDAEGQGREAEYARSKGFRADLEPEASLQGQGDEAEWQGHLERALRGQSAAGRGIGPVLARLGDLPKPRVPWERRLRRLMAKALSRTPRRSYRRPRRRWIAAEAEAVATGGPSPAFEPALLRDRRHPRIVIGVDSSGSVPDAQLRQFSGEISGIARRLRVDIHVLWFDERVYDEMQISAATVPALMEALQVRREGGTSFVDVLERAAALDPSAVVILTDLDGPLGPAPRCPVIWACPVPPQRAPAFGEVLTLEG